ncbi:MAG TPA: class I SAM-dependent methyltransferase [Gammaproteobacteria bacterium]|nr:class I SAM-dependent methyltransferase [Gammaproteobacteria bacterium]
MSHWMRALVNGYRKDRFGINAYPALSIGKWLIPAVPPVRAHADAVIQHLRELPTGGRQLLDIGCGNGLMLSFARDMGWSARGVELDSDAVAVARSRGLDVKHGDIRVLAHEREAYDMITCSHVIEHVHDPLSLLSDIYRLLKPEGILWLQTPNIDSLGRKRFGPNWRGLEPPRHLVLFSSSSLKQALRNAGFVPSDAGECGLQVPLMYVASHALARGRNPYEVSPVYAFTPVVIMDMLKEAKNPGIREVISVYCKKEFCDAGRP